MKLMITRFLSFIALVSIGNSWAAQAENEKIQFDGVDITAFVDYYRPGIETLKKPVTIFNWSNGANDPFWTEDRDQENSELVLHTQNRSKSFWRNFGSIDGGRQLFGIGLYAAADPVSTYYYGGGPTSWVLLQIELPIGSKIIDIYRPNVSKDSDVRKKMRAIARKFKCPDEGSINFFIKGGADLDPFCRELVQKVFADIYEIDAFAYSYPTASFKACKPKFTDALRAFVITNPNIVHSENINYYTRKTLSDRESRIRIQTLFFKASQNTNDPFILGEAVTKAKLNAYLKDYPQKVVQSSITQFIGVNCITTAKICESTDQCEELKFEFRPDDPISAAEATQTMARGLLWPDLEGIEKSPTINSWLLENMYACDGKLPYSTNPVPRLKALGKRR